MQDDMLLFMKEIMKIDRIPDHTVESDRPRRRRRERTEE